MPPHLRELVATACSEGTRAGNPSRGRACSSAWPPYRVHFIAAATAAAISQETSRQNSKHRCVHGAARPAGEPLFCKEVQRLWLSSGESREEPAGSSQSVPLPTSATSPLKAAGPRSVDLHAGSAGASPSSGRASTAQQHQPLLPWLSPPRPPQAP